MNEYRIDDLSTLRGQMVTAYNNVVSLVRSNRKIVVIVQEWSKSRDQEKKYHAMIGDIARQVCFYGKKRHKQEIWKALLVEQFAREKEEMGEPLRHPGETIMSLDGKRNITVRPSTKQFLMAEAAEFIEYLYMQGTDMGVRWSEPALKAYQSYQEAQPADMRRAA